LHLTEPILVPFPRRNMRIAWGLCGDCVEIKYLSRSKLIV
jgi:hypothetical protein